jgi:RNA polymerase sigma-70 factor (ECF subfamily)
MPAGAISPAPPGVDRFAMDDVSKKLLDRWQAGDQDAASALFHRYADRLIALARSRLSAKLAQRVDPEDVVQSAYRSFFARAKDAQFDLQRGGDLWRLLVTMVLHKINDEVKYHGAAKRTPAGQGFGSEDSLFRLHGAAYAREPTPVEAVALAEEMEQLMSRLEPGDRQILELRLQGHTLYEIAAATDRSVPTVSRILDRVRQQLGGPSADVASG